MPPTTRAEAERDKVHAWRVAEFRRLGFTDAVAVQLAAAGADLGQVRALIAAGCPRRLARRIAL